MTKKNSSKAMAAKVNSNKPSFSLSFIILWLSAVMMVPVGLAAARGGSGSSGGGGGVTSSLVTTPCVELSADKSNIKIPPRTEIKFSARSCSTQPQTITTTIQDIATSTALGTSCGSETYSGPTLQLAPGETQEFSLLSKHGTCFIRTSETHNLSISAVSSTGSVLSTAFMQWREPSKAEAI